MRLGLHQTQPLQMSFSINVAGRLLALLLLLAHALSDLYITNIEVTDSTLAQLAAYTFKFMSFSPTPANTTLQILFPNEYASSSITSCTPVGWQGSPALTCNYAALRLTLEGGFPSDSSLQDFGVRVEGIRNPIIANREYSFRARLRFPNGTVEDGVGQYRVAITTANATCSLTLLEGFAYGDGTLAISYESQFISANSTGYVMKLSMLESYPSDPTRTDIGPILNVTNSKLANYLFQFAFVNSFSLNMMMPPSTAPQPNFIYIMTSNSLGDYDKCYLSITGVQPNEFAKLTVSEGVVQSVANLTVSMQGNSPILQTDVIRINFNATEFNLSNLEPFAMFSKGVTGLAQVTRAGSIVTIKNIASYVIISELQFTLQNVGMPFSTRPQPITFSTDTDGGFLRDRTVYSYTSRPGVLGSVSFVCVVREIGYTTSCTLNLTLAHIITNTSYIEVRLGSGFRVQNGFSNCPSSGPGLNVVTNCTTFALTNTVQIAALSATSAIIFAGSVLVVTIPGVPLPNVPGNYTVNVSTKTSDGFLIDTAGLSLAVGPRVLGSGELSIQSSSRVTSSATNYQISFTLPLNLGIPYTLEMLFPFRNVTVPSVNNNLLLSSFNTSSSTLRVLNVGATALLVSGFVTAPSVGPVTLSGSLSFNGTVYFSFLGYDIAADTPNSIATLALNQSNFVVGRVFMGTLTISGLEANDIVRIPSQYYAAAQVDCSPNALCFLNSSVRVLTVNTTGLTVITMNLVNNGFLSTSTFNLSTYDPTGVFIKQTGPVSIATQTMSNLTINASQTDPYFLANSTYTFEVTMATPFPPSSINNLLAVTVPATYAILGWNCVFGCAPQPPPISNTLYLSVSSTSVKFTLLMRNPVSFLTPIFMTSSSLGDMDFGSYLPSTICDRPCQRCSAANSSLCLSCYEWASENKLRDSTCVSECPTGEYFQNSTSSCKLCQPFCLSCVLNATNCYNCLPNYFFYEFTCVAECPTGYYKALGECGTCELNCLTCDSATACTTCTNTTLLYRQDCLAVCPARTYSSPLRNECIDCAADCVVCAVGGCTQCASGFYLFEGACYGQCPNGFFKAVGTCEVCQTPCVTCSEFSNKCLSCVASFNATMYYYLNNRCYEGACPQTYYISSVDNNCLPCQSPCVACNRTQCLTCEPGLYRLNGLCSSECLAGTYQAPDFICALCPDQCATCSSATVCQSCRLSYFLYNFTCGRDCPDGFYKDGSLCRQCTIPCLTCGSASVCQSCRSFNFFNGTCLPTCPEKFHPQPVSVLGLNVSACVQCTLPCVTCLSRTQCLSCRSGLTLLGTSCLTACPDFYYQSAGVCLPCVAPCSRCNRTGCLTCTNSSLYLQRQQCLPACTDLRPNNATMICQNCRSPCGSCTWSDTCLSCLDPYIFYNGSCTKTCPVGMYNLNQVCVNCPGLCYSCLLAGSEVRCPTCLADNLFFGYSCVPACPNYTIASGPYCLSSNCSSLNDCSTCSNLRCLECATNFSLNLETNKCEPIKADTTILSAISEIPVPFPFLIATILAIVLGFLIRLSFARMFTPLFIYAFVGVPECGVMVLWLVLAYLRGIREDQLGANLRIAGTALVAVYAFLNMCGFVLYLQVTRKDRKYKTWEMQDNYVASVLVTVFSLLVSFRLSVLKYSKLGGLAKFSAILSNDSKMNHENVLAYVAIAIYNIPICVVAAWAAYLQTSMNYLFFTSIEVSVVSVIVMVIAIAQSLSPKGYAMEKKEEYKQGNDADRLDGQSLEEIMVGAGMVEEEYHDFKEIQEGPEAVFRRNDMYMKRSAFDSQNNESEYEEESGDGDAARTSQNLIMTKSQDEKISLESDLGEILDAQSAPCPVEIVQSTLKPAISDTNPVAEQEQLQNILLQAEKRAEQLNRPARPVGLIKRQAIPSLYEYQQSESNESDDEPPPIQPLPQPLPQPVYSQQLRVENLGAGSLSADLEVEERRMGMRKLQHLYQQLKMQQKEEQALRERLQRVNQEQRALKQKQFERARQLLQRNQMNVEERLCRVQQMMSARVIQEEIRRQKMAQIQTSWKEQPSQLPAPRNRATSMAYPVVQWAGMSENKGPQPKQQNKQLSQQAQQPERQQQSSPDLKWDEPAIVDFKQNNQWLITQEQPEEVNKGKNPIIINSHELIDTEENHDDFEAEEQAEPAHWPLDPELEDRIDQVDQRAQMYIQTHKTEGSYVEAMDIEIGSEVGTGPDELIYVEESQTSPRLGQFQREPALTIGNSQKVPRRRVNRSVIDLAPARPNKINP